MPIEMTIEYTAKREDISALFKQPTMLLVVAVLAALPAVITLAGNYFAEHGISKRNTLVAATWWVGCFLLLQIFYRIRTKNDKRILTITADEISTSVGK